MKVMMKGRISASVVAVLALSALMSGCGSSSSDSTTPAATTPTTTFVYTSDAHYGIKRGLAFSGLSSAQQVNGAMISEINRLQSASVALPGDAGVNAGKTLSAVDFVVETGDAVNRADSNVYPYAKAPASAVWPLFAADYQTTLNLKTSTGTKAPLYMTPGNHDVSNAIGYYNLHSRAIVTRFLPVNSKCVLALVGFCNTVGFSHTQMCR
jgi:3',5'-cyclic AMP phosphodiesterase CpdA